MDCPVARPLPTQLFISGGPGARLTMMARDGNETELTMLTNNIHAAIPHGSPPLLYGYKALHVGTTQVAVSCDVEYGVITATIGRYQFQNIGWTTRLHWINARMKDEAFGLCSNLPVGGCPSRCVAHSAGEGSNVSRTDRRGDCEGLPFRSWVRACMYVRVCALLSMV